MIPKRTPRRLSGEERFTTNGEPTAFNASSFWQWSSSELLGNALRGVLAEYIVSMALDCVSDLRAEWDAYDLVTSDGTSIEVKSASYLQSWEQEKYSSIGFSIRPTKSWDDQGRGHIGDARRQAQFYIFCVLAHREMSTVDPMNLDQWDFYILPTDVLEDRVGDQKSISLSSLLGLGPSKCSYGLIASTLQRLKTGL